MPQSAPDVKPPTPAAAPEGPALAAPGRAARVRPKSEARRASAPRAAAPPALDRDARFLEAVRLLARAQRAIDGEPALALVLLEEMGERVPRELLGEERDAALVVALCKTGQVERARRVAAELSARSPSSIYAARIDRSCGNLDPTTNDR
jgi:hypothetical protein